jgi:hypothetical protein
MAIGRSRLGWRTPFEFAQTFHPRRDMALRNIFGSAPVPLALPAQPGKYNPPAGTQSWTKSWGQRQKFIRSLGKQLKQCAEKIFYTNKKYQQIIDGTSVDRASSEPRCCARRRSTPEAFSKYSRATP